MKKLILLILVLCSVSIAEAKPAAKGKGYKFTDEKVLPSTSVKDQFRSGTCWCFSTISFLENEILRTGGPETDLAEMWVVRHAYYDKGIKYVRLHGNLGKGQGGAASDVTEMIKKYGIVPEEIYRGLNYGTEKPVFGELDAVMYAYLDAVIQARNNGTLTPVWMDGFNAILDTYFGPRVEKFTYNGVEYTPMTYAESLPIDMDDYVHLTSYTHHPFYTQFILEVPDNWMWMSLHNLPIDELMAVIDHSIANGYSVEWATDMTEKGFSRTKAIGIVPEESLDNAAGTDAEKWGALTQAERDAALYTFDGPVKELTITQEMRQTAYDNYQTTDDHGMVIVGTAHDQAGNPFFKVKNSWNIIPPYDGYYYFSRPFVQYKTMSITVNRNSIPQHLREKLNI